jgi:hypothetical protein
MRVVGVILLVVALVLGIVAIRNYVDGSRKRARAVGQLIGLPADSPLRSFYLAEVAKRDVDERNDTILGLIAGVLLIGSLAMVSRPAGLSRHR